VRRRSCRGWCLEAPGRAPHLLTALNSRELKEVFVDPFERECLLFLNAYVVQHHQLSQLCSINKDEPSRAGTRCAYSRASAVERAVVMKIPRSACASCSAPTKAWISGRPTDRFCTVSLCLNVDTIKAHASCRMTPSNPSSPAKRQRPTRRTGQPRKASPRADHRSSSPPGLRRDRYTQPPNRVTHRRWSRAVEVSDSATDSRPRCRAPQRPRYRRSPQHARPSVLGLTTHNQFERDRVGRLTGARTHWDSPRGLRHAGSGTFVSWRIGAAIGG
jgi:hypothetical protein